MWSSIIQAAPPIKKKDKRKIKCSFCNGTGYIKTKNTTKIFICTYCNSYKNKKTLKVQRTTEQSSLEKSTKEKK